MSVQWLDKQGELHCKVLLSQKYDEPSENVSTNISSVINSNSGVLERNCSRPENNVTLPSTDSYPSISKEGPTCRCSWNSLPHILLICGSILVAVILFFLYIKENEIKHFPEIVTSIFHFWWAAVHAWTLACQVCQVCVWRNLRNISIINL